MNAKRALRNALLSAMLILSGCATMPRGPSVLVLPGRGKSFERFQAEDGVCRQWAGERIGTTAQYAADHSTASNATLGTAIGAGAGALLGAASGHPGTGAAIGAGGGLLVGTAAGANAGEVSGSDAQRRYDHAYMQCMYAKGNQIPGSVQRHRVRRLPPPPPSVPPDYLPSPAE